MVNDERRLRRFTKITMPPLLVLAHRLPYPPNRGDKIRSFHLLRWLSQRFDVYLGTFFDDPNDEQYIDALRPFVKEIKAIPLSLTLFNKIKKTGSAFLTGSPITLACFHSPEMQLWVHNVCRQQKIGSGLAICSSMAPYLMADGLNLRHRVIDFIDLDSDKWRQYQSQFPWPMSALYKREHERLFAFEREVARHFDHHFFVSQLELQLFNRQTSGAFKEKGAAIANGIEGDYYRPQDEQTNEPSANLHQELSQRRYLVFTGTMNATANIESVEWFLTAVWPSLKLEFSDLELYVVGNNPTARVQSWSKLDSVTVTGGVPDVRPYLQHSRIAIAPMLLARGVQNKVLEAMAMAKPVAMTERAAEGLTFPAAQQKLVAFNAKQMIESVAYLLTNPEEADNIGSHNRQLVLEKYSWSKQLNGLTTIMSGELHVRH